MKILLMIVCLLLPVIGQAKVLTDSLGRQVEIPDDPKRIVVGESRMIYTLALVEEGNPAKRVVGWPADLRNLDRQTWDQYTQKFPAIGRIAEVGNSNFSQLNPEKIIALSPDLVILPVYARKPPDSAMLMQQLASAGIPVLFLDFRVDPLNNTVASLRTLGEALNTQQKAERFIAFYDKHMRLIHDRLKDYKGVRPRVMLQLHLGKKAECCTTVAHGNLADMIAYAGGDNIAAGRFPAVFGQISAEAVLTANPDIYVATGSAGPESKNYIQLGPQVDASMARSTFVRALQQDTTISALPAVEKKQAYVFWQNFYMSPWHLLAVEFFAKSFHPELFRDLMPEQTLKEMNEQFLPVPETGTYWSHN